MAFVSRIASHESMVVLPKRRSSLARRAESRRRPKARVARKRQGPVLLVVTPSSAKAKALRTALVRRFGSDYRVRVATSTGLASAMLDRFHDETMEVALVLADFRLSGMDGIEFLARAHTRHPEAKRALLVTHGDHDAAAPIHRAMALGQLELTIDWPWQAPEETLYPQVGEALAQWWRAHRPRFERVRIIGERWDPRSHELRDLGTRNCVAYGFYPASSAAGRRLLAEQNLDASRLPVVIVDGEVLVDPSNIEIADVLGATTRPPTELADVAIIGAGPAGLTAAVYAASEGLRTVVIEPEALGGQASGSAMIRNYLGFPQGISGEEITRRAHEQALHFGAKVVHTHAATGLRAEGDRRIVTLSNGSEIAARAVVLATGVSYRRLGVPALERLVGSGVFYGAASAEARAFAGEDVFVVGAGNSAGQAAVHLATFARSVTLLVRGESLEETMSAYLIQQIAHTPNVAVRLGTEVVNGHGAYRLERLVLRDASGALHTIAAGALFVQIGGHPRTDWLDGALHRDTGGYLITCRDLAPGYTPLLEAWPLARAPLPMETSMPGVFAIGDVRHNSVKRVASAVGEGAIAIFAVHRYLAEMAA